VRQIEQVLRLGAAHRAQGPVHLEPAVGRLVAGARGDAVLGQPARQILAGDLPLRPSQRRSSGVAAPTQAPRAPADEQAPVQHGLAGID
jgi:hypothetical protein